MMEFSSFILLTLTGAAAGLWNNLNCPAPRSPENGLSFIFRNGELVHFRCHPGYMMMGKAVAYCVDNHWSAPAPECIRIRKANSRRTATYPSTIAMHDDSNYYRHEQSDPTTNGITTSTASSREEFNKNLFNWDNRSRRKSVYGDGPRRVPLINGIWPGQDVQLMALGPQTTPGPADLIKEEINIAELRQKQYEEVAKERYKNRNLDLLPAKHRKNKKKKNKNKNKKYVISNDVDDYARRETLISLGTTHDGKALSISLVKPLNDSNLTENDLHKYRHRDPARKRKGKKWHRRQPESSNVIARSSRVDNSGSIGPNNLRRFKNRRANRQDRNEVAEFRRLPVSHVTLNEIGAKSRFAEYDTSCLEAFYGRDVPMIAPQISNAFVFRYETKKNKEYPFNSYMQVKYKCMSGHMFADNRVQVLDCKEAAWVGEVPRCIPKTG